MKLIRIVTATVLLLAVILFLALQVPGNVTPAAEEGAKLPPLPAASSSVRVHFLVTARAEMPEAFTLAKGSLFEGFEMVHGAILVGHGKDSLLFDSGLGTMVDEQFEADMPYWLRPFMAYEMGVPVVEQLRDQKELPYPDRIFLSHAHWDHASGIVDFPDLQVWLPEQEYEFTKTGVPPAVFPSQVNSPDTLWQPFTFNTVSYAGFTESLDLFGDGTVVLVSLSGHSPGSVGMFVNADDGVRRFFIGDAAWNVKSVETLRRKFWVSSSFADGDAEKTDRVIAKIHALSKANPELKIISAHDYGSWR